MVTAPTVFAATTFGNWTGPVWLDPGYQFTIEVESMTPPDKMVCLTYTYDTTSDKTACTCNSPDCAPDTGIGTWVCQIPDNLPNTTVSWDMSAYTPNCGAKKTQGPTGSFGTGPTAVTLTDLSASASSAFSVGAATAVQPLALRLCCGGTASSDPLDAAVAGFVQEMKPVVPF